MPSSRGGPLWLYCALSGGCWHGGGSPAWRKRRSCITARLHCAGRRECTGGKVRQENADILIVGAGQAGAQTAADLRRRGFAGSILLVGDEPDEPYERPPLSKAYLAGQMEAEQLPLRSASFWSEAGVDCRTGLRVTALDPQARTATTADGLRLAYGKLVWAAGGGARRLQAPGAELKGVYTLRTRADADHVRAALGAGADVVLIGGGYIGLEAAASIRSLNKRVTIVEAQSRVLARSVAPQVSQALEAEHRARGVRILTGAHVAGLLGRDGRVTHVQLSGGEEIAADLVLVGIGLEPHDSPLATAGAVVGDGVHVDLQCRTSLPDVWAVGDCARQARSCADGRAFRIESVANALDQAAAAAAALLEQPPPPPAIPWFWSDQYDLRLQSVGLSVGHDDVLLRGDPTSGRFSVVYLRGGQVIALDCLNAGQDFLAGKRLVAQGARPDRAVLCDPQIPLKALLAATEGGGPRTMTSDSSNARGVSPSNAGIRPLQESGDCR